MPSLDVFNGSAFNVTNLTAAIEKAPFVPHLIGSLNLFTPRPIRTKTAWIEDKQGKLAILNTAARGSMKDVRSSPRRKVYAVAVPHVPYFQSILADDVQDIRAFGSETEMEALAAYINDQLEGMRADHEVTHEYHRVGAIKGIVLDGDNTTELVNFYTLFGTTQQTENFVGAAASVDPLINGVTRKIATALGSRVPRAIIGLAGDNYFDAFVSHASVREAYRDWQQGAFLRATYFGKDWSQVAQSGIEYRGVFLYNYRGIIGDVTFVPTNEAYFFPLGIPDMFLQVMAPGDMAEVVNTRGKLIYASQERMPHNKGVELHTQSNVLFVNTRPRAVIKSTYSAT